MVRIAVVSEKPSLSRMVVPHIVAAHPGVDREAFVQVFSHPVKDLDATFDIRMDGPFRFPHGMSWSDFPAIREPAYKPFEPSVVAGEAGSTVWMARFGIRADDTVREDRSLDGGEAARMFSSADIVYAVMDASSSAVHAFHRAVDALVPAGAKVEIRYPWCLDATDKAISEAVSGSRSWHLVRDEHLAHSISKRRFTYNYALNAHAVLGREMSRVRADAGLPDLPDGRIVASRNALQLLYAIRVLARPTSEGRIMEMMDRWRGTGRYPLPRYGDVMGSAASRWPILRNLIEGGLVHSADPEARPRCHAISPLGEAYLDRLHPDCEDPDQGMRLENWRMLPLEESIPRIDRYLRTFFGKQKRYGARVR